MYDPVLQERRRNFGVSGLLYQSTAVLYDQDSLGLWPQLTGTAISGRHQGHTLEALPFSDTTWGQWRAEHPNTLVLSPNTGFGRTYGLAAYANTEVPPGTDSRLPHDAYVWGVQVGDHATAYPHAELLQAPTMFDDAVGSQAIHIHNEPPGIQVRAVMPNGAEVPVVKVRWFAWSLAHPQTDLYVSP